MARRNDYRANMAQVERELEQARRNNAGDAVIAALINQRTQLFAEHGRQDTQMLRNGQVSLEEQKEVTRARARVTLEEAVGRQQTERAVQEARVKAEIEGQKKKEATIESARIWTNKLTDPKLAGLVVLAAAGIYAAKHGTQLLAEW